jgi:nucleoside-diphosphate-sugar epimerase
MRIAITGGTGFVGRHLARRLSAEGHETVLISRGKDERDLSILHEAGVRRAFIGLDRWESLAEAFSGCEAVAHCAGINREIGAQTYQRVHVEGTRNVVRAAQAAGVKKIALLSFLRARPGCGSPYHESKWAAEEIIRASGLDYTILKAGVIYGKGDHMLDHLSHAFHTFPIFALVGMKDKPVRPTAVEDMVRILRASLVEGRMERKTVYVLGPEEMPLREAVMRVASVVGKRPFMFRAPIWFHRLLGHGLEAVMKVPLVSLAQVRILSEGVVEPWGPCEEVPEDLLPARPFSNDQIRNGLPEAKSFGLSDLRRPCEGGKVCA